MKDKMKENPMKNFKLEKVTLNIGGTGEKIEKGFILLQRLTNKKPIKIKTKMRIPTWDIRPGMEVGTKVTLRGKEALAILKKMLPAVDNTIKESQVQNNFFSFGIHEYIEIPGVEYMRDVGIMGFELTAVFSRAGKHSEKKKVKRGKARRLTVSKQEIENYLETKFNTTILRKQKKETQDDSK